jgi:Transglutaminase-like superfamily
VSILFLKAYWELISFDLEAALGRFEILHGRVRNCPIETKTPPADLTKRVCSTVDMASIWYWKQISCLVRSAATTCLLRRHGVAAQLVIGAQQVPFKAHAWVEVDGRVVNDKPYAAEKYAVLDRC